MGRVDLHCKVFGLGLSKTGTSSLTEALNRLGVRSIHYPHDVQTHEQLRNGDYRLRILDEYQGVTDITVAPYFAQLDRTWPGSKFILTVREKESWLRSAELHWRLLLEVWDRDPQFRRFTEFILASVYGTVGFNRERMSYVYDAHVRNVTRYFQNRPDDLLVLDICAGNGWDALCRFLGLVAPDEPFPHVFEWMHRLLQATRDTADVIPPGETFLLVDQGNFGAAFSVGRHSLPFPEREGTYDGLPANDESAIQELERLRRIGAGFMVFTWPAFWWLDFYSGFDQHLRRNFRCVLRDERLVIFDLRRAGAEAMADACEPA
jgi:hypothetical protein